MALVKQALISLLFLFTATGSYAGVKIWSESCISDHVEKTNCYQVRTSIYSQDEDGNVRLVAEGYSWVGSDCPNVGHKDISGAGGDCSPVTMGNSTFITSNGSPGCLNKYLEDPEIYPAIAAGISAAIDRIAERGAASKMKLQQLNVFPNPAHDYLSINISYGNTTGPADVTMYDAAGKAIASMNIQHPPDMHFTLSLKDIAPGYYTVVVKDARGILGTQKVLLR